MKRDLSKPLAPTFGTAPKRKKTVTKNADGSKTTTRTRTRKDGSLAKRVIKKVTPSPEFFTGKKVTRDVQKQSRGGDKVTIKNKTTQYTNMPGLLTRTTKVKAKYSSQKGKENMLATSASVKKKAGRHTISKSRVRGIPGNSEALSLISSGTSRTGGIRNKTTPKKGRYTK